MVVAIIHMRALNQTPPAPVSVDDLTQTCVCIYIQVHDNITEFGGFNS